MKPPITPRALSFPLLCLMTAMATVAGAADAAPDPHAGHGLHSGHAMPAAPAMTPADTSTSTTTPTYPATTPASGAATTAPDAAVAPPGTVAAPAGVPDAAQAQGLNTEPSAHDPQSGEHVAHGSNNFGWLKVDQLEAVDTTDDTGLRWKGSLSWGDSFDRLWLASEGEQADGTAEDIETRLFVSHAVSPWWNATLGLRADNGPGDSRQWVGIGLQGLAPYWFETAATLYASEGGQTALRLDADYELLLTNWLILQPELELNAYGKDEPSRLEGAGLADTRVGLRLRYEISRQFAPYVGVEWTQQYGNTRDAADALGERTHDTRAVAGVRMWY